MSFEPAAVKPTIESSVLSRVDIRVGTIVEVARPEELARSKHLVELTVEFGDHRRPVIAGLAQERDDVAALIGSQALFVVNLPPRKLFGRESRAMLFDVGYEDGIVPVLAQPETEVPNGVRAG